MTAEEELVNAYIECIQDAYIQMRKRWKPDYRGHLHQATDNRWRQCARILAQHQADPYAYVQYVFDILTVERADVYENEVTGLGLTNSFLEERPKLRERVRLRVQLQSERVSLRINSGEKLDEILNDPYAELSPIFKFAAAWSQERHDLAALFQEDARRMMLFEPLYAELLCKWLPAEWIQGARNGAAIPQSS